MKFNGFWVHEGFGANRLLCWEDFGGYNQVGAFLVENGGFY